MSFKKDRLQLTEDILTLEEAAQCLRLSKMTVLRLAHKGCIPGAKIGRLWRFSRETILNLVKHPELIRGVGAP